MSCIGRTICVINKHMLRKTYESAEQIPEGFRSLYTERDGQYHLTAKGIYTEEDINRVRRNAEEEVSRIKRNRDEILDEKKTIQERFRRLGLDVDELGEDELDEIVAAVRSRGQEQGPQSDAEEVRRKVDSVRQTLTERMNKERETYERKLDGALNALKESIFERDAVKAVAAEKGHFELLEPALRKRLEWDIKVSDDGTVEADYTVTSNSGGQMIGPNGEAGTLADLVAELKQDKVFGRAFDGSGSRGVGDDLPSERTGSVTYNPFDPKRENITEQIRLKRENPALYRELKQQARRAS